ncbi:MAG TPA: DUF4129 domain-containing protein [Kofleriaceae bacterium]|nr:DUF4129 domain-containing protein [Kofleriaceae bacterium]
MTGHVARLVVVATVLVAAAASSHAQRDPWDGPAPPGERAAPAQTVPPAAGDRAERRESGSEDDEPTTPVHRTADDPAAAARIEEARRSVLDDEYQADLPAATTGGGARTIPLPGRRADGSAGDRGRSAQVDVRQREEPHAVSSLMYFLMWGLVIAVGVLGAAWLFTELSRFGGDARLPLEAERVRRSAAGAIIERPLEDADELARRGQFAEAIHTLLLRTLRELARSASVQVAPADTSREVLARVPLIADARTALAGLITAVEITHFGDEPAGVDDYDRCRRQFHVFAQAFAGAPRAQAAA